MFFRHQPLHTESWGGGGHLYPDGDRDIAHPNTDFDPDSHRVRDFDAYVHRDENADCHRDSYFHSHADGNPDSDRYRYLYPDGHRDALRQQRNFGRYADNDLLSLGN